MKGTKSGELYEVGLMLVVRTGVFGRRELRKTEWEEEAGSERKRPRAQQHQSGEKEQRIKRSDPHVSVSSGTRNTRTSGT
jgi:hypothetical protein